MKDLYHYFADNWLFWGLLAVGFAFGSREYFKGATAKAIILVIGAFIIGVVAKDPEFYGNWFKEGFQKLTDLVSW